MKKWLQITIVLCLVTSFVIGQAPEQTFEWNDSKFEVGQIRSVQLLFAFDGPCSVRPCYEYAENGKTIDLIVNFLQSNPKIEVEIGVHSDQRANKSYSRDVTHTRAKGVKKELLMHGVEPERLTCRGYSSAKPIIPDEEIEAMQTKGEKELAYFKNRRVEIKITKN